MTRASLLRAVCKSCLSRGLIPLTVALCACFLAQGVGKLAVAQLSVPPTTGLAKAGGASALAHGSSARQIEAIVDRDIFCSHCLPAAEPAALPAGGEKIDQAQLFATVIPERAADLAFAALHHAGPGSWRLVAAGDELQPGFKVVQVTSTGIVVASRDGHQQVISLPGVSGGAGSLPVAPAPELATVQRTGDTSFLVQRRALLGELRQTGLQLARGKGVGLPIAQEGAGLRVSAEGPDGLVARLGLRQGDLVLTANDQPLHSLQDLLGLHNQLMGAEQLTLGLRRGRDLLTHVYTIR